MIGKKLAHYEVTGKLGEGSMGAVYRARDLRLHRDVALKVLPESFSKDPHRMVRFELEAQVLASINHPNVAAIYGLEESGGVRCLVLELIEGPTLREHLDKNSLSFKQAIDMALQIARALEATHAKGITHRDLNPANIKILENGMIKVLDFGLAKVFMDDEKTSPLSTKAGVLLGTPAYMSPEQIRGGEVDSRADIWAFGCVLFEMLTGEHAFLKSTVPDTLTAVLDREPEWGKLLQSTPTALRRLLGRCLAKEPQHRLRHTGDAILDLEEASEEAGRTAEAPIPVSQGRWRSAAAVGLLGLVAGLMMGVRVWDTTPAGFNLIRQQIQITDEPAVETWPSLSPDGQNLVYAGNGSGNWDIYFRRVDGQTAINLTENFEGDDHQPSLSPDGGRIAFQSDRDGLEGIFVMGATGESVRRLTDFGANPAWSPDGEEIVFAPLEVESDPTSGGGLNGELWVVNVESEGTRQLATAGRDAIQPSWSPSGYRIAFWGLDRERGSGQRDIWTIPAEGGEPTAVTEDVYTDWNPIWSPDGQYIYFSSDRAGGMNVWRVRIDERTGIPAGQPEQITTGGFAQQLHLTLAGSQLAYAERRSRTNIYAVDFDPETGRVVGEPLAITRGSRVVDYPDVSRDGQWLTYMVRGAQESIMASRTDGSDLRRLTNDAFKNRGPRWSPDGTQIAFYSDRSGSYGIWVMDPDGSGQTQITVDPETPIVNPVWSPDGARLVYAFNDVTYVVEGPDWGGQTPTRVMESRPADWSPDGRRLANSSALTNPSPLRTHSFETGETLEVSTLPSFGGRWLDDRRLVFASDGEIRLIDVDSGLSERLLDGPRGETIKVAGFSPDRRTLYVLLSAEPESDIWLMTLGP